MARLTSTASGVSGEASVLALLLRAGLRVAKPYWGDDEIDLLVFVDRDPRVFPIPIQVKAVQSTADDEEKPVQNLKKRYIESNKYLCLMVYSVDRDKVWLIPTAASIRQVYVNWATQNQQQRKQYADIGDDEDVRIRVNVTTQGDVAFDEQYLLPKNDFHNVIQRFNDVSNAMQADPDFKQKSVYKFIAGLEGGLELGGEAEVVAVKAQDKPKDKSG